MFAYGGGIRFLCLEAQTLAEKQSSSKSFFITHMGHSRHCLATMAFVLDIYLWWLYMYFYGSITIMWSLDVFINDFTSPCWQVKNGFVK